MLAYEPEDIVIKLIPFAEEYRAAALCLETTENQRDFTPTVEHALAQLEKYPEFEARAYMVVADNVVAGFFLLEPHPTLKAEPVFKAFLIDASLQGQGIGSETMQKLKEFARVEFPNATRLFLCVHPGNIVARSLYEKQGFAYTGGSVPVGDRKDLEMTSFL